MTNRSTRRQVDQAVEITQQLTSYYEKKMQKLQAKLDKASCRIAHAKQDAHYWQQQTEAADKEIWRLQDFLYPDSQKDNEDCAPDPEDTVPSDSEGNSDWAEWGSAAEVEVDKAWAAYCKEINDCLPPKEYNAKADLNAWNKYWNEYNATYGPDVEG